MKDLKSVTAVVLAGGFGTRLRSVVADRPKVMADVAGRPYLTYLLDLLDHYEFNKVVLCTGYLVEKIEEYFGDNYKGLSLVYSKEFSPLGTAGALRLALPLIDSDQVLVLNGDSFFDINLLEFFNWHQIKNARTSIALNQIDDTSRFGRVQINSNGEIIGFREKGILGPGLINAGIYLITKDKITEIPERVVISIEKEIFPRWIGQGFYGFKTKGKFIDIGTPESYAKAAEFFASKI